MSTTLCGFKLTIGNLARKIFGAMPPWIRPR